MKTLKNRMEDKASFISAFNLGSFLLLIFIISSLAFILRFYINTIFLLIVCLVILYVLGAIFITRFYLFNDFLFIKHPFSIFDFDKRILYDKIGFVKLLHKKGKYSQAYIVINLKCKKEIIFGLSPFNSFVCENLNKRKEILIFLKEKGLRIVIESDYEEDLKLLN